MKNKKIFYYILSFLIPFLIFNIVFLILDISFLSSKNVLTSDMQAQYYPLLTYYQNIFNGTESVFYSYNSGLGNSMMSTIAYYLASPLNIIVLLFNPNNLYKGISLLITLKIALAGLTMNIYLKNKVGGNKLYTLLFSTCYALMAYIVNYYFNIMWLDGVFLAPLILLGIDHILKDKKTILFAITLFLAVLSNYYIAYMIILFSFIYFCYSLFIDNKLKNKKDIIKYFKRYVITGILSVLAASFLLVPGILQLADSNKSTMSIFSNMFQLLQNPLDIFSKTFIGTHSEALIINEKTINIYMGLIVIPLLFFYLVNKNILKREKIGFLIIFIIFILSITIRSLHMIWHTFSLPQGFNYRNSFLFCLFFIMIANKSLNNINYLTIKSFIAFYIFYLVISLSVLFLIPITYSKYYIYISLIIMLLYILLLYSLRKNVKDVIILIFIMVIAELFFNTYISYRNYAFDENALNDKFINETQKQIIKYNDKNDFYRIEKNFELTSNDSLLLNYKGISYFLSTSNKNINKFLRNIGLNGQNLNISYSLSSTHIIDSLLGIRYILTKEEIPDYKLVKYIETKGLKNSKSVDETYIYENPNYLNLGYMISNNTLLSDNINPYQYQNSLLNNIMNDNSDYFKEVTYEKNNGNFVIPKHNDDIYIYLKFDKKVEGSVFLYIDDFIYKIFKESENILRMPAILSGRNISFKVKKDNKEIPYPGDIEMKTYTFDSYLFETSINSLKEEKLEITSILNTEINGNISVKKTGTMMLTLPYQKGFNIYVNGKLTDYYKVFDTFIGIDLEEGKHDIKIIYKTPYLHQSIIISLVSFGLLIIYIKKQK